MTFVGNPGMICGGCGLPCPRNSVAQRYCHGCSTERDKARKREWSARNQKPRPVVQRKAHVARAAAAATEFARLVAPAADITKPIEHHRDMVWTVRVRFPFSYAMSKNAVWSMAGGGGHVFHRKNARSQRDALTLQIRRALGKIKPVEAKVYLDILVQKSNHRGDAINVVDLVCDAVKDAIGVDDRWFCIRGLDWEISKADPVVIVGISQRDTEHMRPCSSCGRIQPLSAYRPNKHTRMGITRDCKDCLAPHRALASKRGAR